MSTAIEIENAIRGLPTTKAHAVAKWLQDYLARKAGDDWVWFWIGRHDEYDAIIGGRY